jgi:exodeoxyribonuclease-5
MELTKKQEEGLKIAIDRHRAGEKYTVIAGYAGTGKSTLVRFIIDALDVEEGYVAYTSFTGKAAEVLRKKGNPNAMTLHKLLYDSIPRAAGGFFRKPKANIGYTVVVVDEISMVPKELINLLFKHKVYVICLGDPFQLPPINKDEDNHLLDNPHIFLDEIMRQEADSEIIQLTMKIRNNEPIDFFQGKDIQILPKEQLNTGMLLWADQILTATNQRRLNINAQVRALLNRGPEPEDGDKVICLRNYWDDYSINGDPMVNGTIGTLTNVFRTWRELPKYVKSDIKKFDVICGDFVTDDGIYEMTEIDRIMLMTGMKCCDWRLAYKLGRLKNKYGEIVPKEFAYGYAITCHKAQGSSWEKVLVIEENFPFDKKEHARWLYTACTRASEKLVLVR